MPYLEESQTHLEESQTHLEESQTQPHDTYIAFVCEYKGLVLRCVLCLMKQ